MKGQAGRTVTIRIKSKVLAEEIADGIVPSDMPQVHKAVLVKDGWARGRYAVTYHDGGRIRRSWYMKKDCEVVSQ